MYTEWNEISYAHEWTDDACAHEMQVSNAMLNTRVLHNRPVGLKGRDRLISAVIQLRLGL